MAVSAIFCSGALLAQGHRPGQPASAPVRIAHYQASHRHCLTALDAASPLCAFRVPQASR